MRIVCTSSLRSRFESNLNIDLKYWKIFFHQQKQKAVIVAQLTAWLLPIPEVCGSNPDTGKFVVKHLFTVNCIVLKRQK